MKLDYEEKKAELEAPFQPIKFGINIDNFLSDILSIKNTFYVCFFFVWSCLVQVKRAALQKEMDNGEVHSLVCLG